MCAYVCACVYMYVCLRACVCACARTLLHIHLQIPGVGRNVGRVGRQLLCVAVDADILAIAQSGALGVCQPKLLDDEEKDAGPGEPQSCLTFYLQVKHSCCRAQTRLNTELVDLSSVHRSFKKEARPLAQTRPQLNTAISCPNFCVAGVGQQNCVKKKKLDIRSCMAV